MPLSYSSYLKLDQLLSLQSPLTDQAEHDEQLFIIVHQVYELWFKQLIHEMEHLRQLYSLNDIARSLHTINRILAIFRTLIQQVDVMETLTPLEFLAFRTRLASASGFQSYQFRQLEFLFGFKNPDCLKLYSDNTHLSALLEEKIREPSLWQGFLKLLVKHDYAIPDNLFDVTIQSTHPSEKVQAVLIDIYNNHPPLTQLCEAMVDLDAALQDWRYRHIKMVERTIGRKPGTGGSSGVEYLQSTLFKSAFEDLWLIRSKF